MREKKKRKKIREKLWGCPKTRNRTNRCWGICNSEDGVFGYCGRYAHHFMEDRTQRAIKKYKKNEEKNLTN